MAEKNKKTGQRREKSKKSSRILLVVLSLMAAMFMPTTVVLIVGLLPTFAVFYADRSREKTLALTIGALNLAGCFPFLFKLWSQGNSFDKAVVLISSPDVIVIIYMAAATGYLLDWAMSGIVSNILYQQGLVRMTAIQRRKDELISRWGPEVTGDIPLDHQGFPNNPENIQEER